MYLSGVAVLDLNTHPDYNKGPDPPCASPISHHTFLFKPIIYCLPFIFTTILAKDYTVLNGIHVKF